jgi:hypothetical protein
LLQNVRDFMRQEMLSAFCVRRVLPLPEHHVPTDRVRPCVHCVRGSRRLTVRVDPHAAEVMREPLFHKVPSV